MIFNKNHYILKFIKHYNLEVEKCVRLLETKFDTNNIYEAWRTKKIPRGDKGEILNVGEYQFHGVGCMLEYSNGLIVDFDFGPNGRYDGFDLWRLEIFLEGCLKHYSRYQDLNLLAKDFKALEEAGIISCPHWSPGSSLYYFFEKNQPLS